MITCTWNFRLDSHQQPSQLMWDALLRATEVYKSGVSRPALRPMRVSVAVPVKATDLSRYTAVADRKDGWLCRHPSAPSRVRFE